MTNVLNDVAFYNDTIKNNLIQVQQSYQNLLNNYFVDILEKKKIKNNGYFKFIFYRGIQTINHVFIILFMYIKNIAIVSNECKKAYFYYIEFIEQIMDEDYNFLHLSSIEATMFVYKKTIYELNQNYRKTNSILKEKDKKFINDLSEFITNYNKKLTSKLDEYIDNNVPIDKVKQEFNIEN